MWFGAWSTSFRLCADNTFRFLRYLPSLYKRPGRSGIKSPSTEGAEVSQPRH